MLEEYKEATQWMRHDDQMAWTILGLSFTLAFGTWAYTFKDIPFWSTRAVLLSAFGVFLFVLGRMMARRITALTESRRKRAESLEQELGFELLSRLGERTSIRSIGVNRILDALAIVASVSWICYLLAYLVFFR